MIDITKCPLTLNKIEKVLQCMKNGTLCGHFVMSIVKYRESHYVTVLDIIFMTYGRSKRELLSNTHQLNVKRNS